MSPSPYTVLETLVDLYRQSGDPVTARAVAASLDHRTVEPQCRSLRGHDLLEATGDGYRPTVTAHELLALDVDADDVLVLDVVDD